VTKKQNNWIGWKRFCSKSQEKRNI